MLRQGGAAEYLVQGVAEVKAKVMEDVFIQRLIVPLTKEKQRTIAPVK